MLSLVPFTPKLAERIDVQSVQKTFLVKDESCYGQPQEGHDRQQPDEPEEENSPPPKSLHMLLGFGEDARLRVRSCRLYKLIFRRAWGPLQGSVR